MCLDLAELPNKATSKLRMFGWIGSPDGDAPCEAPRIELTRGEPIELDPDSLGQRRQIFEA